MVATKEFQVRVRKRERVVPMHPIVQHSLPFSNLDLLLPPKDVGVFLCYKRPSYSNRKLSFELMVSTLKTALAQALVHYYVFSSDVVRNSKGEAEILCNNQGVEFTEAYANIELCELNLHNPDESVEGKLLLPKQSRVLSVQATELKCGGIVVGCTFDHRIADAYSGNMFLVSWAEIANSKPITMVPSFTKSFLNPRLPSSYDPSLNDMYIPISSLPPRENNETPPCRNDPLISRIYHVNAEEINNLQSQANGTKLESFSAFMWKLISKHASISQNEPKVASSKTCKMGIVVDGRTRLVINKGDNNSMQEKEIGCYFGNVLSVPFGEKRLGDLIAKPLNSIAQEVHEFLRKAKSNEHFQDLIDWVEVHRPKLCLAKIYSNGRDDGPAFVVSSGQRFPVSKVDFGWGKPIFGSYHFPWGGNAGYVMPMPSSTGNGDWIVYMHLTQGQLEFIEKEASHVFNRFKLF